MSRARLMAGALVGLLLIAALAWWLKTYLGTPSQPPKPVVHHITLLKPPPPPPKVEEKPPEPEVKKEEVKLPDPEPVPAPEDAPPEPPPGPDLGVDAAASGPGDSFGLVGKPGGAPLIGRPGGSRFGAFTGQLQRSLQEALSAHEELRRQDYRVVLQIWLDPDGRVRRIELVDGSGDAATDSALRVALRGVGQVAARPPEDLPQPIKLRVTSRG